MIAPTTELPTTTAVTKMQQSHHTIVQIKADGHHETHSQLLAHFNLPFLSKPLV